jgi:N-acetylneuraminate synthase
MTINVDGHMIGIGHPPFVIAEISGNHDGSLEMALELVEVAAESGVHAIKLQTYTADTMTLDVNHSDFRVEDPESLWCGSSLHELYDRAHTPWEWHRPIFELARSRGLVAFSTPFDRTAVDFLEDLDVPCYKIASFENVDIPLIQYVAQTGKPMVISTGMASLAEIEEAVAAARDHGCTDLVLLKCTSAYPAPAEHSNLATIPDLRRSFTCEVGLSDHTLGIGVAVASVAMGATVIEKHITLSRSNGAVDSAFSMEPWEMRQLVMETGRARSAVGSVVYGPSEADRPSLRYRRSLYVVKDLRAGDRVDQDAIQAIRPGFGLPPKHLDDVLGRRLAVDVTRGTPVSWKLFE